MGPVPEPHSYAPFKSSGDFMQHLAEMPGQEFVWSFFSDTGGHSQYVRSGPRGEERARHHFLFGTRLDRENMQ